MKNPPTRLEPRWLQASATLAVFVVAIGCETAPEYRNADFYYFRNEPERVELAYEGALQDQGKNALLGTEKLLSTAIARGDWQRAEELAIRASTLCNIFLGYQPGERDALSLLGQEKDKPFKGEPHERVMVDCYLGLLRYQKGDYEGALAAFRSAIDKDRGSFLLPVDVDKAKRKSNNATRFLYNDDYALLRFFVAKCYELLNEPENAARNLGVAKQIAPELAPLFDEAMDPRNNVIAVIEGGQVPRKRQSGPQGAILAYSETTGPTLEQVEVSGHGLSFSLIDDLYDQATTLGKRQVDQLNREKAIKQEAIQAAGLATSVTGYFLTMAGAHSNNRTMQYAGLAAIGAGVATMIIASTVIDPRADTREWSLLPRYLYFAVGSAEPMEGAVLKVEANGVRGSESQTWTDVPVKEQNNLYWMRLLPGRTGGRWPAAPTE